MSDKQDKSDHPDKPRRTTPFKLVILASLVVGVISHFTGHLSHFVTSSYQLATFSADDICPQSTVLAPDSPYDYTHFQTPEFRNWSLNLLQEALRVPTEAFDDLGEIGEDPRWNVFYEFENTLKKLFPLVHKHLQLDHVNTHGLLYTWQGSDDSLKPSLFMAHQDVVPVLPESRHLWKYDPYSAHFDGEIVWSRGASDMKNTLVGLLTSIELLLKKQDDQGNVYIPKRTILLGFGFDEEIGGLRGAAHISKHLETRYGKDGLYTIIDEGGLGVTERNGVKFALPGIAEKGMYDISIELHTPGGHSSMPPGHTGIGIMSSLVTLLEDEPFEPTLSLENPTLGFMQCIAGYSDSLPAISRLIIAGADKFSIVNSLLANSLAKKFETRLMVSTTQAIDVINGGLKINTLPEKVTLLVNHRVALDSSSSETRDSVIKHVLTIANKYNVGVLLKHGDGDNPPEIEEFTVLKEKTAKGYFVLFDYHVPIEPSPVSPHVGAAWETLAGTIRYVFQNFGGAIVDAYAPGFELKEEHKNVKGGQQVIVAPALMIMNTDTRYYWNLTRNIFRFSPLRLTNDKVNGIHTTNEHIPLEVYIDGLVFYYSYILNLQK